MRDPIRRLPVSSMLFCAIALHASVGSAQAAAGWIDSPEGQINKSCVSPAMPDGAIYDVASRSATLNGNALFTLPECQYPLAQGALASAGGAGPAAGPELENPNWYDFSWITPVGGSGYADFFNGLYSTWQVPPFPGSGSDNGVQVLYIFNSLQNSWSIMQPVLQLNHYAGANSCYNHGANNGCYWTMQDVWVDASGTIVSGPAVQVNVGDTITGKIWVTVHRLGCQIGVQV